MLAVRLRLTEIDYVPEQCIDDVSAEISKLSKVTEEWSFRFSEIADEDETELRTYRVCNMASFLMLGHQADHLRYISFRSESLRRL